MDFPGDSDGKASAYKAGDPDSIPGSGRSPREGNGNPLQYSCLGVPRTEEPCRLVCSNQLPELPKLRDALCSGSYFDFGKGKSCVLGREWISN